jgi:LacI family transcriptional regulator
MQDVARESGVSQATVSLVLNSVAGIRVSEQTRTRVIEVAEQLGYRRASRVRADTREASSIGLIIDELSASPFAIPLLEGAREAAWEHSCVVDVVSTRNHAPMEAATIESMLQRPLVGIIYATLFTRQVVPPAIANDVPLVLLNCYDQDGAYASTVPDDFRAAHDATTALIKAGHRRIGHLAGELFLDAGRDRLAGYRSAIEEHGIVFDAEMVANLGSAISAAYDGTIALIDSPNPPSALFCFNDRMALGAQEAARERGLSIPHDLSIVGFDNDPFATALFPNLTTAVLPHEGMARWAVQHLFDMRRGGRTGQVTQVKLECQLVRRKSIARPRQRGREHGLPPASM